MARTKRLPSSAQLIPLIAFIAAVAALYFARDVLVPFALAVLLSFLLTPVVRWLERWKFSRVPAVLVVMSLWLVIVGGIGWIVTNQLVEVLNQLPGYRENIHRKIAALHGPASGPLTKAAESVQELSKELETTAPNQPAAVRRQPAKSAQTAPPATGVKPVPVEIVQPPPNALQSIRNVMGPMLRPLGDTAIVIVFAIFLLMKREDVRNRLIRLVGDQRLNLTTQALDDAGQRVSRYLMMQLLVNASYATVVATGLYFIGVQSALLWGVLAGLLRFIPFVGPIAGGALPIILSLAEFDGWTRPLLCFGLFLVVELITANALEPWLYGAHTGLSALAILVAAVCWTVLWGTPGLILSTPLTVCLVVLGRYTPQLAFLHVLLGDEPVLSAEARLYQRLLAMDQEEAVTVINAQLKEKSLVEVCDSVILPALSMAEQDRHTGALDEAKEIFIHQSVNEWMAELPELEVEITANPALTAPRVLCFPASDQADEIAASLLGHCLERAGYTALAFPLGDSPLDLLHQISSPASDVVCISALAPFALMSARAMNKRLRREQPELKAVIGLWNFSQTGDETEERLSKAFTFPVVTSFQQALDEIGRLTNNAGVPDSAVLAHDEDG